MPYTINFLPLDSLLIDTDNPRLREEIKTEDNAIQELITHQSEKLINLAEDIVNNGLNPSETLIVYPHETKPELFIVLEGNRRLSAIRILQNPPKYRLLFSNNQYKKVIELSDSFTSQSQITMVQCVIYKNKNDAQHWIEIRHSAKDDGRGLLKWGAQEKRRHNKRIRNIKDPSMVVLDQLVENELISEGTRKKIPITNFDRLIRTRKVQEKLGIKIRKDNIEGFDKIKPENLRVLSLVAEDLSNGEITVSDLYHAEDRLRYFNNLITKTHQSQNNSDSHEAKSDKKTEDADHGTSNKNLQEKNQSTTENKKTKPTSIPHSTDREYLIPKDLTLPIHEIKNNDVFQELKTLKIKSYPNAVSVLFRLFLEFSTTNFLLNKRIKNIDQLESLKLNKRITIIADYLEQKSGWSKHETAPFRDAVKNPDSMFAVANFHKYVHNHLYNPDPATLIAIWNNFQSLIIELWS